MRILVFFLFKCSPRGRFSSAHHRCCISICLQFIQSKTLKALELGTFNSVSIKRIGKSNYLFSLFLDETMTYSCAVFKLEGEDLKVAQLRKISLLIENARINKEHEILEIGCGWGSFAVEVVKKTGCKYTGISLSEEQLKFAEIKVKEAGLQRLVQHQPTQYPMSEELSIGKIKFKAFDLGGHQIARRVWKDYYAKGNLLKFTMALGPFLDFSVKTMSRNLSRQPGSPVSHFWLPSSMLFLDLDFVRSQLEVLSLCGMTGGFNNLFPPS